LSSITRRSGVAVASMSLAWALVGVGAAAPASAHTALESSDPANGAVLKSSPKTAKLVFSEKVKPVAGGFGLHSSASHDHIATGKPTVSRNAVTMAIKDTLAAGGYVLTYSVTSEDGHPVKGTIAFRVRG
jgi:methionine-rich copper-binding protein CopC